MASIPEVAASAGRRISSHRAVARVGVERETAAREFDALAHRDQAQARRAAGLAEPGQVEADAVVGDLQVNPVVARAEVDADGAGTRMLGAVGERLLHETKAKRLCRA